MPEQTVNSLISENKFVGKISHTAQVGGIETSVMDNGYSRGVRIAWINTGSGMRYKVVLDRAMDIADAAYNQYNIAWYSPAGIISHQPMSDKGIDWLRTFGGGLLTTCGLSHVGGPEKDEFGERGLHGLISNTPAEVISIVQPNPLYGRMDMSITGIMREARIFGPVLELKRTISSRLGESWINIRDEIVNRANTPAPHMLLYHFNFGWPLVDAGTKLVYRGEMHYVNEERDKLIFNTNRDYKTCPHPLDEHRGAGEAAAYFDIGADDRGKCRCGMYNPSLNFGVSLEFDKAKLPWLTNWQHWAPNEYVTGLEPGTNPPIGQSAARKNNSLIILEPGETRTYDVRVDIMSGDAAFKELLNYDTAIK